MPHPTNETNGMADILIIIHQGDYDGNLPKKEEYIDCYRDQYTGASEFAYNIAAPAAGSEK